MAKVYEFLANGFEEIEGLAPVDILQRWCRHQDRKHYGQRMGRNFSWRNAESRPAL